MPFISLPSKPGAQIAYDFINPEQSGEANSFLIVFINGLGLPAESWKSLISEIQSLEPRRRAQCLTYDRYGQGATKDHDPLDSKPEKDAGYGHDMSDAAQDLHELLKTVIPQESQSHQLILVASSIGAHIARLYTHRHPGSVSALLILDSNIGNQELTYLWPDPQAPEFDPKKVEAEDCSLEQYIDAYTKLTKIFNSDVKNPESLDRRNVKDLLPDPASPKLIGPENKGIWLTVVGHDPVAFEEEGLRMMKTPRSLTARFTNP
ncbi:hypothetical protein MMC10_010444 [Thelotrema lepadinum]|nr:hypothetical protein [Thelotrema lepadinum]